MAVKGRQGGFTLIETITVLVILGLLGVLGSMAAVNAVRGYKWAEDNAHLAQKAQVALTRIAVELAYATDVSVHGNGRRINYDAEYPDGTASSNNNVGRQGNQSVVRLALNGPLAQGRILIDGVAGFTASLESSGLLAIELQVTGANEAEQTFRTSIALR